MNYSCTSCPLSSRSFGFFFRIAPRNSRNSFESLRPAGNWISSVT